MKMGKRFLITGREFRLLFRSAVFRLWLKKSWKGILSMGIHFVFMIYFLEPAVRYFFPPQTMKFLGLIEIQPKGGETWEKVIRIVDPVFWIGGLSLFFAYMESRIRPSISEAAQKTEQAAD
jgi:hypothetical protein